MTDEPSEQFPERDAILRATSDLGKSLNEIIDNLKERIDNLEKTNNIHFEAIRKGIAENNAAFHRLEAKFYDAHSDISNLRADIKELSEELRRRTRGTLV